VLFFTLPFHLAKICLSFYKVLKHPYFAGMQETVPHVPSSANVQQQQQVVSQPLAQTIDLDSEIFDQLTKHSSTTPKPILNNKTNQPVTSVNQPFSYNSAAAPKNPQHGPYKDSIGDLDDMINDFEKKYSTKPSENNNNNNNNRNASNNNSKPSIGGVNNQNNNNIMNASNSTRPVLKTPVHIQDKKNSTANIKETLLAQFKEDPVFGELVGGGGNNQGTNNMNSGGIKIPTANLNISNPNLQLGNRRNSNLTSIGNSNMDANSKIDSNLQKKKFDDLFNNFDSSNNSNKNPGINNKRK
jgi:hypothetical protein